MGEQTKADVVSIRVTDGDTRRHRRPQPRRRSTRRATPTIPTAISCPTALHRRHAAHRRHRPHRPAERRPGGALRQPVRPACSRSIRRPCSSIRRTTTRGAATIDPDRRRDRDNNPRLQNSAIAPPSWPMMKSLDLPNPKMMDVAVPANMRIGLAQKIVADRGWALSAEDAKAALGDQRPLCERTVADVAPLRRAHATRLPDRVGREVVVVHVAAVTSRGRGRRCAGPPSPCRASAAT